MDNKTDGYERYSDIFTTYKIDEGTINARVHYTSQDGTRAISYCQELGRWFMTSSNDRRVEMKEIL